MIDNWSVFTKLKRLGNYKRWFKAAKFAKQSAMQSDVYCTAQFYQSKREPTHSAGTMGAFTFISTFPFCSKK